MKRQPSDWKAREAITALSRRDAAATLFTGLGIAALAGCATDGSGEDYSNTVQASLGGTSPSWVDTFADLSGINNSITSAVIVRNYATERDGGGGLFVWQVGSAVADQGTIVVPSTPNGGYWRRVHDGTFNVRWFGAKGDGSPDTIAVQAAINALPAGGKLVFPPGTYCVDGLTLNSSNITLQGAGKSSILAKDGGSNALLTLGAVVMVTIRDLAMTTKSGVAQAGWAIYCGANASWPTLDNLYIYTMKYGIGFLPGAGSQVHNFIFRNVVMNQVSAENITLFNCVDGFISDSGLYNIGYASGGVGLNVSSGCDGLYVSNLIVTQGNPGIVIQDSNPSIATNGQPPRHLFFSRTASDGAAQAAWAIWSAERCHFEECWAATQQANASGYWITSPARNLEFANCIALNCSWYGYRMSGGKEIGVNAGQVLSCAYGSPGLFGGIHIVAASGVRINGVRIGNDRNWDGTSDFANADHGYGVVVNSTAGPFIISNCDLRGNISGAISDGTGASVQKFKVNNLV